MRSPRRPCGTSTSTSTTTTTTTTTTTSNNTINDDDDDDDANNNDLRDGHVVLRGGDAEVAAQQRQPEGPRSQSKYVWTRPHLRVAPRQKDSPYEER